MKEIAERDRHSICCLNPTSVMDGWDGRSQEETFSAWFTFPWSYEGCYLENSSTDKGSWCFLRFTSSRENIMLCKTVIMMVVVILILIWIIFGLKAWDTLFFSPLHTWYYPGYDHLLEHVLGLISGCLDTLLNAVQDTCVYVNTHIVSYKRNDSNS